MFLIPLLFLPIYRWLKNRRNRPVDEPGDDQNADHGAGAQTKADARG